MSASNFFYTSSAKKLREIQAMAKRWGYKNKSDNATFCNGYFAGFAAGLDAQPKRKTPVRKTK